MAEAVGRGACDVLTGSDFESRSEKRGWYDAHLQQLFVLYLRASSASAKVLHADSHGFFSSANPCSLSSRQLRQWPPSFRSRTSDQRRIAIRVSWATYRLIRAPTAAFAGVSPVAASIFASSRHLRKARKNPCPDGSAWPFAFGSGHWNHECARR